MNKKLVKVLLSFLSFFLSLARSLYLLTLVYLRHNNEPAAVKLRYCPLFTTGNNAADDDALQYHDDMEWKLEKE